MHTLQGAALHFRVLSPPTHLIPQFQQQKWCLGAPIWQPRANSFSTETNQDRCLKSPFIKGAVVPGGSREGPVLEKVLCAQPQNLHTTLQTEEVAMLRKIPFSSDYSFALSSVLQAACVSQSSKPWARELLSPLTSARCSSGERGGPCPPRPGCSVKEQDTWCKAPALFPSTHKLRQTISLDLANNPRLSHQPLWSSIHSFQKPPPSCVKSSWTRSKHVFMQMAYLMRWQEWRGAWICSLHPYPISRPRPGSLWTERDVKFLGMKQRDLLGADQEAEPCTLVLIRWQ